MSPRPSRGSRRGGRLVAITGHNTGPEEPGWRQAFVRLQERARVVFTAAIAGQAYARHGTTMDTRLTVIDRIPAEDPAPLSSHRRASPPMRPSCSITSAGSCRRGRHRRDATPLPSPAVFASRAPAARPKAPPLALVKTPAAAPEYLPGPDPGRRARLRDPRWLRMPGRGRTAHARASTRAMRCNRSAYRMPARIRRSSCSRRRWPRSPLPAPPTGRTCRRTCCPTASCRTRSSRA